MDLIPNHSGETQTNLIFHSEYTFCFIQFSILFEYKMSYDSNRFDLCINSNRNDVLKIKIYTFFVVARPIWFNTLNIIKAKKQKPFTFILMCCSLRYSLAQHFQYIDDIVNLLLSPIYKIFNVFKSFSNNPIRIGFSISW